VARTKEMDEFVDRCAKKMFGRSIHDPRCVTCGSEKIRPYDFRDDLSRKEFTISHMCQACQDSVFGGI